jgi:hypothetical protein
VIQLHVDQTPIVPTRVVIQSVNARQDSSPSLTLSLVVTESATLTMTVELETSAPTISVLSSLIPVIHLLVDLTLSVLCLSQDSLSADVCPPTELLLILSLDARENVRQTENVVETIFVKTITVSLDLTPASPHHVVLTQSVM